MLLDIHEYEDLEITLDSTRRWANEPLPYDSVRGVGTYFSSPFHYFLSTVLRSALRRALRLEPPSGLLLALLSAPRLSSLPASASTAGQMR